jgi:outer membrane protein insertion porin family
MKFPGRRAASLPRRGRWGCFAVAALSVLSLLLTAGGLRAQDAQGAPPAAAEGPLVQSVNILQNQFLQTETLLYYVSTKAGDRYDEFRVKEDFRRLWDTGFLDDLLLDVRDGPKGKIVNFVVRERRRVQIVDYRGSKAVTTSNIEDKLKEKDAQIKIDTFYDPAKARKVESIIKEMLDEKGLTFATVKHDAKNLGGAGVQLSFVIDEGPKARVKAINFEGNQVFTAAKLRGQMKKIKQSGFWNLSWLGGKTTYTEEKWADDQEKLRDFYLNNGYVTATVGEPTLTYADAGSKKKPAKDLTITVPVTEGDQYRVGTMKFEGLTVFKEEGVRNLFKQQPGDVYDESKFKKAYEKLRDLYGSTGYFQWTGFTKRTPDPARKVVDVVISMEEDKRYYIGRIKFTGNNTTRDKVIRREIYMNEGEVFNTEALKASIRRVNQLGYFKPMEGAPDFQPSALGEDKLDVTFKVQEQNRNQFTFGGGVSGLEGTFVNASFSTANFLGAGETLSLYAQTGARTKNYQVAITEPYFLDRPITAGIDLFKRKITYDSYGTFVGYTQGGTGVTATTGLHFRRSSQIFLSYSYEVVTIEGVTTNASTITTPGTPLYNPFLFGAETDRHESRVSPSFVHNTTDSPFTPRAGVKYTASVAVAGGPLGGTVNYVRPDVEGIWYWPQTKKTALGIRVNAAWIAPYGDGQKLPYYQRYFLGGEQQIRGYNIRTVGPTDSFGRALGGDKFVLANAEYYFDIIGPLRFLLFFDAGQAYLEEERIDLSKLRTSTGGEIRFTMPVINIPFRLIYAFNPNRDTFQPKSAFKFAVGTTF